MVLYMSATSRVLTLLLAKELGEAIKGAWKFHHDQHGLEVVGYLKPRRVTSGKVRSHFVNGGSGVLAVGDLDVHSRFELEVGGDDAWLSILFLEVVP